MGSEMCIRDSFPQTTSESLRGESSVTSRLLAKAGGLAGVRDRLKSAGVSEGASNLIINSRRDGTSQSYESAWKRWTMWCSGRGVDPVTCPVNDSLEDHFLEKIGYFRVSSTSDGE